MTTRGEVVVVMVVVVVVGGVYLWHQQDTLFHLLLDENFLLLQIGGKQKTFNIQQFSPCQPFTVVLVRKRPSSAKCPRSHASVGT